MVIAHLVTTLKCGGAENQLQQLVLASDRARFRHIVISLTNDDQIGSELKVAGIEVYSLEMNNWLRSLPGMVRLIRLLRRHKPDLLHCWLYHACLAGLLATRLTRVSRLIWALRSANPGFLSYSAQTRAVVRMCGRLSAVPDGIIVNSEIARAVHEQWGYRTDRMRVIANGVDAERFFPDPQARKLVRNELGITDDCILVGMIARYHPMKDHETFLRAATLVAQRDHPVHFLFVGEGMTSENEDLSRLLHSSNLAQRVHLLGPRRDIPRLTAALDVACLSSWSESLPNVVLEAMACGVPSVSTSVGDAPMVLGGTGKIVPPRDPLQMAAAITELIAMSPAERSAMGQRARERAVSRFSVQQSAKAYEHVYDDLGRTDNSGRPANQIHSSACK